jgi:hypothetical protein
MGGAHGEPPLHGGDERLVGPASATIGADARRGGLAALARKPANIIATVLLVVLLASGGVFILGGGNLPLLFGGHPSGQVEFVDGANGPPGHTDALHISATGLPTPPQGSRYYGWILNQQTERTVPLGALAGPDGGSYTLAYAGDGAQGRAGTNLLTLGDKLEITLERGAVSSPFGSVALAATMPPKASVHIQHLLVAFPTTPGNIGLLVGLLEQTQALDAQAALLRNAQANKNPTGVQCGAQIIINIIEGSNGTNYRPLGPACQPQGITQAGDGFGLLGPLSGPSDPYADTTPGGYLADATDHASLAATQPDATSNIRTHAAHVETAITNITGWVTTADRDALALLKAPTNTAATADLVTLCDHAYHGVTATSDQQVNPVPGQAGAITAYEHGQFMATLTLAPGK